MREVAFRLLHDYFFLLYLIWCMFLLPVNEFPVLQLGFKPNQPHAEKRHRCSPMLWPPLFLFFFFFTLIFCIVHRCVFDRSKIAFCISSSFFPFLLLYKKTLILIAHYLQEKTHPMLITYIARVRRRPSYD